MEQRRRERASRTMRAMVLRSPAPIATAPLHLTEMPRPEPGPGEVQVEVEVFGVCRTDLHVVEGDLKEQRPGIIPGHEVVGRVSRLGPGANRFSPGQRVGIAWLHAACGRCHYCLRGDENLCASPRFTGWTDPGGYADALCAPENFVYALPDGISATVAAPMLCAGIIGYRALMRSAIRPGEALGLYGFGASAHIVLQIAHHWGCSVYVSTRGDRHQALAREMGAAWVGGADAVPPVKLQGAILFAPVGKLVPVALAALDRGGTLAVAGIHVSDIPALNYQSHLFQERSLRSVTANTRSDGEALLRLAAEIPLKASTEEFRLEQANEALFRLRHDEVAGAAVLRIRESPDQH
jgi:propanol-preferring alcohol dehydrogenase